MAAPDPRTSGAYQAARRNLRDQHLPCWICRHPIDYSRKWPDPWSFTADHALELDAGGHPTDAANLRAAHARCNIIRGNLYRQGRDKGVPPIRPERDW